MRFVYIILLASGITIFMAGAGSLLNYFFNLEISIEGSRLPSDPASAVMFFVVGFIFTFTGFFFTNSKIRKWASENRAKTFILFIALFVLIGGGLYSYVTYSERHLVMHDAIKQNNHEKLKRLMQDEEWSREVIDGLVASCLHYDKADAMKIVLENGGDAEHQLATSYHETPLLLAVYKSSPELVNILINAGADPLYPDRHSEATSIMHTVAGSNSTEEKIEIIKILLKRGVNINTPDKYEKTPLLTAVNMRDFKLAEFLISKGADVNCSNKYNESILYRCINHFEGNEDDKLPFVRLLLKNGALKNDKADKTKSPLEASKRKKYTRIIKLLM